MQVNVKKIKAFKINNRKGYACVCKDHLTEGRTVYQAYRRMVKALKRNGMTTKELDAGKVKRLLTHL